MENDSESAASMSQLAGIVIIANSLLVAAWWVMSGRPRQGPILLLCSLAVVAGIVLMVLDRAAMVTVKKVTAINAAAEQATADAEKVAELRQQLEASRASNGELVKRAAAEAGRQAMEISAKNAEAAKNLQDLIRTLQKADAALAEVEVRADAVRNFTDIARLNLIGKSSTPGAEGRVTPISLALAGTFEMHGTQAVFKEDSDSERTYRSVIERFPRFPFAYWVLADLLKRRGDPSWTSYAYLAEHVLKKTTEVPGHDPGHDDALQAIEQMLGQVRSP